MDERAQYEIDQTTQREAAYRRQIEQVRKEVRAQRRYEIAKAVLAGLAARMTEERFMLILDRVQAGGNEARVSLYMADALLAELEK